MPSCPRTQSRLPCKHFLIEFEQPTLTQQLHHVLLNMRTMRSLLLYLLLAVIALQVFIVISFHLHFGRLFSKRPGWADQPDGPGGALDGESELEAKAAASQERSWEESRADAEAVLADRIGAGRAEQKGGSGSAGGREGALEQQQQQQEQQVAGQQQQQQREAAGQQARGKQPGFKGGSKPPAEPAVLPEGAKQLRQLQAEAAAAAAGGVVPLVDETTVFPPGNEDEACVGRGADTQGVVAAVVTLTFDRPDYLQRMLDGMLSVHGSSPRNWRAFPLFISQDGSHSGVQALLHSRLWGSRLRYLQHAERAPPVPERKGEKLVYYRIANHYKFIFRTFFYCFGYDRLIILEDDMQLAPDFFSYFEALAPVLDNDPTLYCVSSWNDHGQDRFVRDSTRLYRSDFFPGLGWMTNRATWDSIKASWPRGYWDDWMRLQTTRRGRQCVRPEVCRNYNFGEHGSSAGQFFRQFLKPVQLNQEHTDWGSMDLSYLHPERYAHDFSAALAAAQVAETPKEAWTAEVDCKVYYRSQREFERIARTLRMMSEWKDGVPRGAYQGVVTIRNSSGRMLYVAPHPEGILPPEPPAKQLQAGRGTGGGGGKAAPKGQRLQRNRRVVGHEENR